MEITIRLAEQHDYHAILELIKEFASFASHPDKMINTLERMNEEKDYFNCFIAETEDKQIIGYATYFLTYHTWIGKCMYMDDIYITQTFRKHGTGKKLLDSIIEKARAENCHKLRWQVSSWNKNAQEFYKKMGAEIDNVELNCDLILK